MSLLHQDSPEELDDAALGEDLTKGTSHMVVAAIVAVVVVSIAIAVYMIAGQKPPVANGEILKVWAHPRHSVTSGQDAAGAGMARESFDQMLVFARVKLHNQSDKPIFLHRIETNATLNDGPHTSFAATKTDYERVFIAYPELAPLRENGLSIEETLNPGQTVEGTFVSSFRITKQQWDARKDLSFTFGIQYHPSLTLTPHSAVTEQ
jgi:hypothetical protein